MTQERNDRDVILNKIAIIERCIKRIEDVYENNPANLQDFTKQDSIILNIQRACEASIDIAMYVAATSKLGIPQTSREAFELLQTNGKISLQVAQNLKGMVGFRNIAVHDYQKLNTSILQKIVEKHLNDFVIFKQEILKEVER
ncbi:MAG: DUF86 domain-containing protein [Bacillaceae bacterium]|nr:DUF86 domain-containing protein [Bacillaceae bacterium]